MSLMRFTGAANRASILLRVPTASLGIPRQASCINGGGCSSIFADASFEGRQSINRCYSTTPLLLNKRHKVHQLEKYTRTRTSEKIHDLKRKVKNLKEVQLVQPQQPRKSKRRGSVQLVQPRQQRKNKKSHYPKEERQPYKKPPIRPLQAPFSIFASCLPGLEPTLLEEVQYLQSQWHEVSTETKSNQNALSLPGGVKLTIPSLAHLHILHLYLGTASHIYLRLNDDKIDGCPPLFTARGFPELKRKLKDLIVSQRWDQLLDMRSPNAKGERYECDLPWELQVRVSTSKSKLMHTKAVEERVRETLGDVLGIKGLKKNDDDSDEGKYATVAQKDVLDRPVVRLLVRIERDIVQLSLDTSSSDGSAIPLHMRGYRLNPFKAPLREDLAFAQLMAGGLKPRWNLQPMRSMLRGDDHGDVSPAGASATTGYPQKLQLFDPFCGSGTLAIESVSILAGLPPGRFRPPPLAGTRFCDPKLWDDIKSKALSVSLESGCETHGKDSKKHNKILVAANDVSKRAIDAAKSNAQRAEVEHLIDFTAVSFKVHPLLNPLGQGRNEFEISESDPLRVVTNPPYGVRLVSKSKDSVYKQLTKALYLSPYKTYLTVIGSEPRELRKSTLPLKVAFSTKHGGLSVVVMTEEH